MSETDSENPGVEETTPAPDDTPEAPSEPTEPDPADEPTDN